MHAGGFVVEVAQVILHEGDEPDPLAHLRHPHILPRKHLTETDLATREADAAAPGDGDRGIVVRIGEGLFRAHR